MTFEAAAGILHNKDEARRRPTGMTSTSDKR